MRAAVIGLRGGNAILTLRQQLRLTLLGFAVTCLGIFAALGLPADTRSPIAKVGCYASC